MTDDLRERLEQIRLVSNSMRDVVTLGRFARSVDPMRLVADWKLYIDEALAALEAVAPPQEPTTDLVSGAVRDDIAAACGLPAEPGTR